MTALTERSKETLLRLIDAETERVKAAGLRASYVECAPCRRMQTAGIEDSLATLHSLRTAVASWVSGEET